MQDVSRVLNFEFKGVSYPIEFPNVGKFRNVEVMKQSLSGGTYGAMIKTNNDNSFDALDMIDMEAYLTVLAPDLIDKLECKSFSDLGLIDWMMLKDSYVKQFIPWWSSIKKLLNPQKED